MKKFGAKVLRIGRKEKWGKKMEDKRQIPKIKSQKTKDKLDAGCSLLDVLNACPPKRSVGGDIRAACPPKRCVGGVVRS